MMNIWSSAVYQSDIRGALPLLDIEQIRNKKFLITGAAGLVCSAVVDVLICCNLMQDARVTIYAAGRNIDRIKERFSHGLDAGVVPVVYDATTGTDFDFRADYIIHGASNASPNKYMSEPVDTLLANVMGISNLLNYAVQAKTERVLYVSSSEVYGKISHGKPITEEEFGDVDILEVRSSYSMGKRAAETLCVGYASQYGVNVSIVRLGHIYGPTAQDSDQRVSSAFAKQAVRGENIVMKSLGTQRRSYCHCIDCATAMMTVLTRGVSGEAYNISNKDSIITIRQMAERIAAYAGVELIMDVPSDAEKAAFNPMDNSSLDSRKLEALGWTGQFDADKGFSHTVSVLRGADE